MHLLTFKMMPNSHPGRSDIPSVRQKGHVIRCVVPVTHSRVGEKATLCVLDTEHQFSLGINLRRMSCMPPQCHCKVPLRKSNENENDD